MKKYNIVFICNECGYESIKWIGKCPACGSWNSFFEQKIYDEDNDCTNKNTPQKLNLYNAQESIRVATGFEELDRVLGGGLVKGSLVLLGGEPGIGKSTLILEICNNIQGKSVVLYVSGEESAEQIKLRADRLGINNDSILFFGESNIDIICDNILKLRPKLVIIDSIQTMYSKQSSSASGSISQIREITSKIMKVCKMEGITTIIIGHVTKDGNLSGPRVLEHMVDTVLYLEGERYISYRILRSVKNRFGSTDEIGMFEMKNKGLCEITNPSDVLITDRNENVSGVCVVPCVQGTRIILVELQALTLQTMFGYPKRTVNGIDFNRLYMLIAVIEKIIGIKLENQDIYFNVVGGLKINEPAIDLGIFVSIVSSFKNIKIDKTICFIGEIGLTGEIRRVNHVEKRLKEIEKFGFKKCIMAQSNKKGLKDDFKLDIIGVNNVSDVMKLLYK